MRPLVTIVTPAYNAAHWLPQCRASVVAQTYPHIEHVVMDAGSRDGTVELLQSWPDVTWVSEADDGQSDAINKGIARSSGEVVTWLNADDELTPHAVENVVRAMQRTSAEWVVGSAEVREGGRSRVVRPGRLSAWRLDLSNPVVQPSSFYTRRLFERAGRLDPALHLAMDLDLWLRFLAAGARPAVVGQVLSIAHLHEDAKTRAVPAARWYREMGLARAKNGRTWAAGVELGRSLGEELVGARPAAPSRTELTEHVQRLRNSLVAEGVSVPAWSVMAGASTRLAARATPPRQALGLLLRPEPWTTVQTLQELCGAVGTRWRRARSRVLGRPAGPD